MARTGCFNDIRFFVACYGLLILTDNMVGTVKKSCLSTIERRFNLPTATTALLASSFQIGSLTMLLFVSYFGSRWHRPRALFYGSVIIVLGNLIVTLPQFIGGRYEYEDVQSNVSLSSTRVLQCSMSNTDSKRNTTCEEKEPTNQLYILMVIGMMINGVGSTPITPLGLSYIDDFANERNGPLYLGITTCISYLGPILGYVWSAKALQWWVDIGWVDTSEINITPTHPSWVGAWWLGLIISNAAIAIFMVPFLCFPKKMKKQKIRVKGDRNTSTSTTAWDRVGKSFREKAANIPNHDDDEANRRRASSFAREFRELLRTLKRVLGNKTYILVVAIFCSGSSAMVGLTNFFPKSLEVAFGISASQASVLTGVAVSPSVVAGTLVGSIVMKRLNLTPLGAVKFVAGSTLAATLAMSVPFFVGCDTIHIAGITAPYAGELSNELLNITSPCNAECGCSSDTYAPVCGSDNISYVSPCHAGCKGVMIDSNGLRQKFTECQCLILDANATTSNLSWATPERCEFSKCSHLLPLVLGSIAVASFSAGFSSTPAYILLIRSVDKKDKAFAIGLMLIIYRVLAWIPGPVIYGAAIDSSCLFWGRKTCENQAYCRVYNNDSYRERFYGLCLMYNLLTLIESFLLGLVTKGKCDKMIEYNDADSTGKDEIKVHSSGENETTVADLVVEATVEHGTMLLSDVDSGTPVIARQQRSELTHI